MDINSDHQNNTLKENTNLFLPQDQKILHNYNSNKDILNELMQNQRKNLIKKDATILILGAGDALTFFKNYFRIFFQRSRTRPLTREKK